MIGNLFDSPWKILLVAVVLIVLFGSKKLPHAARSLGQSMRILKREVQSLHEDENESPAQDGTSAPQLPQAQPTAAPAQSAQGATAPADQQSQIDALQQQIRDLQRSAATDTAAGPGSPAEPSGPSSPARLGFLPDSVMAKLPVLPRTRASRASGTCAPSGGRTPRGGCRCSITCASCATGS